VLKLKDFYTSDLRIIGAVEGAKGSKYEMSLGALVVGDDADLVSEVGTGIDDDLRLNMWFRHKRGELVGGIVEVIFQERTADNSLRLPVFVRERPEKTDVSWG
jgi:ATP-dependent DNA ligase